jgi:hypothetical protein
MKTTVRLTLDGLVRALRVKAHALAEDSERSYGSRLRPPAEHAKPTGRSRRPRASRELADDRPGR